ncbi:MAG: hypothetical protein Q9168_003039 [Polycauliona sp. 1 TL-2023]
MPKRPCAISFTPDQATIICGDKFGDVYALPLVCSESRLDVQSHSKIDATAQERHITEDPFLPSATLRTVHTQRNQEALRHQQNLKNTKSAKSAVEFERELLFGHVSLLTDLVCVSISDTTSADSPGQTYIITADRDEHIRVSRGIPQAHIIEGFCLGHTQFVSRLCIPSWNPRLLISGGGDDYLLVWDWLSNRILFKVDLRKLIVDYMKERSSPRSLQEQTHTDAAVDAVWNGLVAVSDIFAFEVKAAAGECRKQVAVVCEGIPGILFFDSSEDGSIAHLGTTDTDAAIAALALTPEHNLIAYATAVSHDTASYSGSTGESENPGDIRIGFLDYDVLKGGWDKHNSLVKIINSTIGSIPTIVDRRTDGQGKPHGSESFLRSFETLRKRGQDERDPI